MPLLCHTGVQVVVYFIFVFYSLFITNEHESRWGQLNTVYTLGVYMLLCMHVSAHITVDHLGNSHFSRINLGNAHRCHLNQKIFHLVFNHQLVATFFLACPWLIPQDWCISWTSCCWCSLSALRPAVPRDERRRSLPDMMGFRQKWLHENRTWLYLSCLSPGYMWPLGEWRARPAPLRGSHHELVVLCCWSHWTLCRI